MSAPHSKSYFVAFLVLCASALVSAQRSALPSAPAPQLWAQLNNNAKTQNVQGSETDALQQSSNTGEMRLSLHDAEQLAIRNNPRISAAQLLSLAEHQNVRVTRAAELPVAQANLTAVEPHEGSRIAAGGLNNPIIFERAAGGVTLGQLITDFGRTRNLVASSAFRAEAQYQTQLATTADIVLAVDQAFYGALRAQALVNVAQATVTARQTFAERVQALFNSKLKSQLDVSFANVNLAQARLLLLDAQNAKADAFANLNALLGFEKQQTYVLTDQTSNAPSQPPQDVNAELEAAFRSRPDLAALNDQYRAQERFRRAERDLLFPTISALGTVGDTPVRADQLSPWFGAAGVNVGIPLFNGFAYSARAREADYRAQATQQQVRDLRDRIARDVQVAFLQSQSAFERIAVSQQLLEQANLALDLAQTRYNLGLSSIVELSQAQLQQTEAAIGAANARYDYEAALAALRYQTGQ
jgi:outer membrane protein